MEFRHLRYLVAVADAGSISAAALRLRVSQPSLGRQLRDLEHEIGGPLLDRGARGALLTEAGKIFVADARQLLATADTALANARAHATGRRGELRIGYAPSPTAEILPEALQTLRKLAPDARPILRDLAGDELLDGLQRDELHLAVMVDPGSLLPRDIVFHPLKRYRHCVACAPEHPFARRRHIRVEQLAREPLVIYDRREYAEYWQTLLAVLAPFTTSPVIAEECDGQTSLAAAVRARRGVAVVPEVFNRLAGPGLRLRPLHPAPVPLTVGYAYSAQTPLSPLARRFITALKRTRTTANPPQTPRE